LVQLHHEFMDNDDANHINSKSLFGNPRRG
jgi:hypothetical protein